MALLHPMHLALVALVALLVFGPRKLPELARGVGEAMKELKQTLHGEAELEAGAAAGSAPGWKLGVPVRPPPTPRGGTPGSRKGPPPEAGWGGREPGFQSGV